jgi:hypothetical protein
MHHILQSKVMLETLDLDPAGYAQAKKQNELKVLGYHGFQRVVHDRQRTAKISPSDVPMKPGPIQKSLCWLFNIMIEKPAKLVRSWQTRSQSGTPKP